MDYCTQETPKQDYIRNLKQLLAFAEKNDITDAQAEEIYRAKLFVMTGSRQS